MKATGQYTFRKATASDLGVLAVWRSRPHVCKWWGSDEPITETELADGRVARWIVSTEGRPFAYMQDYTVHGWDNHHFYQLPEGARGIDQFIGEPDMIARGHGPAFISARLRALFSDGIPVVATDPHPENAHAISAYRKSGFREFGPAQETPWGWILPMKIDAQDFL